MRICFPTVGREGQASRLYGHFGSAPGFVIVDTETGNVEGIDNGDLHHAHGLCQPLKALGGRAVDAVVVGGIGLGALTRLKAQGIRVYRGIEGTVAENAALLGQGRLPEFDPGQTCAGHTGGGCAHGEKGAGQP